MNISKNRIIVTVGLIVLAAFSRLLPHPYNFSPIDGLALFSGAVLGPRKIWAFVIPLAALFLSDLVLGFHSTMVFVYGAIVLMVWIGRAYGPQPKFSSLIQMSVLSSVLFFLITNFGFWLTTSVYPVSTLGLLECYIAALPFFHWTVLGDFIFVIGIFGIRKGVRLAKCQTRYQQTS